MSSHASIASAVVPRAGILCLLLLFCLSIGSSAQNSLASSLVRASNPHEGARNAPLAFEHLSVEDGLSNNGFPSTQIELCIEDNGKGFVHEHKTSHGNGLRNMRTRIEDIQGTFDIQSEPDNGTRIRIVVPAA